VGDVSAGEKLEQDLPSPTASSLDESSSPLSREELARRIDEVRGLIEVATRNNRALTEPDRARMAFLARALERERHMRVPGLWLIGGFLVAVTALSLGIFFAQESEEGSVAPSTAATTIDGSASSVSLAGKNLARLDLRQVELRGVDLTHTCLAGARLDAANLDGAKLDGADLRAASLVGTTLNGATGSFFVDSTTDFAGGRLPSGAQEFHSDDDSPCD
jgi:Pentapeptide repeats (8 copies)